MLRTKGLWISHFLSRQAEFLHEIAAGYEAETGLDHWWIGLTDLSKYYKVEKSIPGTSDLALWLLNFRHFSLKIPHWDMENMRIFFKISSIICSPGKDITGKY